MKTFKDSLSEEFGAVADVAVDKSQLKVKKDRNFEPDENASQDEVHDILDQAEEAEEIETVTFGLETDDDSIVKVYVAVESADAFEEALATAFGEEDNIEDLLDELSKEHDIVDVIWPDEAIDDSEDEFADEETPEDDEDPKEDDEEEEDMPDGSESLNPKHKSFAMESGDIGAKFKNKFLGEGPLDIDKSMDKMNPDNDMLMKRYGKNKHVKLAIEVMKRFGIPATALEFVFKRQPALTREIKDNMVALGAMNRKRIAQAFGMDISKMSMDDEENMDDHDIPTDGDTPSKPESKPEEKVEECGEDKMEMDDKESCNCGGTCESCIKDRKEHYEKDEDKPVTEWNAHNSVNGLVLEYGKDISIKMDLDEAIDFCNKLESNKNIRLESNGETISFTPITGEKDFVVHYSNKGVSGKALLMAEHVESIINF